MSPGSGSPFAAVLAITCILCPAIPAHAQIGFGAHIVNAADAFDGTTGVGARVTLDAPLLPIGLALNGEHFFPECGTADCGLSGFSIDANLALSLVLVKPWAGLGWAIRRVEVDGASATERGLTAGVGGELNLGRLHPFLEFRYELVDAPEKQLVTRIGLVYR